MIEFSKVSYRYPNGTNALQDISLGIDRAEVVALVGENGAGKTTLLKHMNGLLRPKTGRVTVMGMDTSQKSVAEISRHVGMVFQTADDQLFALNVEQEIAFGLNNFGIKEGRAEQRMEEVLKLLDLDRYRHTSPMLLSGGEKKKLCLAMVLAWEPEVIILDEPTVGQDKHNKDQLIQMIDLLRSQGRTIVISTHDMEFLWLLQPRVVVMREGKIVDDGPSVEFLGKESLDSSRILRPQLLGLWKGMRTKPSVPFQKPEDAADWIASGRNIQK